MMRLLAFCITLLLCVSGSLAVSKAKIDSLNPTWGHASGGEDITVNGCHFRTYGAVTCQFGPWWSTEAEIVSDNQVRCKTPNFVTDGGLKTVPQWAAFTLHFSGAAANTETKTSFPDKFLIGPWIMNSSPTQGSVNGGTAITINGFGFQDAAYNAAPTVWFDQLSATGSATSDTQITVTTPTGAVFAQDASIKVQFGGGAAALTDAIALSNETFTFGPYITSASECMAPNNTGSITINGANFLDFGAASSSVAVNFTTASQTADEPLRVAGVITSDSVITVPTPNIPGTTQNGETARVVVFKTGVDNSASAYECLSGSCTIGVNGALSIKMGITAKSVSTGAWLGDPWITVQGCGFNFFTAENLELTVGGTASATVGCQYGTATITGGNQFACRLAKTVICGTTGAAVVVNSRHTGGEIDANAVTAPIQGAQFPSNINSATPTLGRIVGNVPVSVTGSWFQWNATAPFDFYVAQWTPKGAATVKMSGGSNTGSTVITANSAPYTVASLDIGQLQGSVQYSCGQTGQANQTASATACTSIAYNHRWWPVCTLNPTFGPIYAATPVSVVGSDWQTSGTGVVAAGLYVTMNIGLRTNMSAAGTLSATGFDFTIPASPHRERGGIRAFGQSYTVSVDLAGATSKTLSCGSYQFIPAVSSISPSKGPIGPATSPTAFTISGQGFSHFTSWETYFGGLRQGTVSSSADTTLSSQTIATDPHFSQERPAGAQKGYANTNQNVTVYFDTCNKTIETGKTFNWGPRITTAAPVWGNNPNGTGVITVDGKGFTEFTGQIDCVIGDNTVTGGSTVSSGTRILCTVPANKWGANVSVGVAFGQTCGPSSPRDWARTLWATNRVFYKPEITGVAPTIGKISGGDTVVVSGNGFTICQSTAKVYFGHQVGTVVTKIPAASPWSVTTPRFTGVKSTGRNEWGLSDVTIECDGLRNRRAWKADAFYFGAKCTGVTTTAGSQMRLQAGAVVTVAGAGFIDDQAWNNLNTTISLTGAGTQTNLWAGTGLVTFKNPGSAACGQQTMRLTYHNNPNWFTECQVSFGPKITSVTSNCSASTTIGWEGMQMNVAGELLGADLPIGGAVVGGQGATLITNTSTAASYVFPSGVGAIGTNAVVNMVWGTCAINNVHTFRYGPTWTALTSTAMSSPSVVYTGTNEEITVTGTGFDCIGPVSNRARYGINFGSGTAFNTDSATPATSTQFTVKTPSNNAFFSESVTVFLQPQTLAGGNTTQSIAAPTTGTGQVWWGPYVTGSTPSVGMKSNDSVVISGFRFDDAWFTPVSSTGCYFNKGLGGVREIRKNSTTSTATAITCKSPDYMGTAAGVCPYNGTVRPFWFNNSLPGIIDTTQNDAQKPLYWGPVLASIAPTEGVTYGGDLVTFTGTNLKEPEWVANPLCVFGNLRSTQVTAYTATQVICRSPEGTFNTAGDAYLLFFLSEITKAGVSWHWTPYVDDITGPFTVANLPATIGASGAGFCGYYAPAGNEATVKVTMSGTQMIQSDVYDQYDISMLVGYVGGGGAGTATFCDATQNCACTYQGTEDTVSTPTFTAN